MTPLPISNYLLQGVHRALSFAVALISHDLNLVSTNQELLKKLFPLLLIDIKFNYLF